MPLLRTILKIMSDEIVCQCMQCFICKGLKLLLGNIIRASWRKVKITIGSFRCSKIIACFAWGPLIDLERVDSGDNSSRFYISSVVAPKTPLSEKIMLLCIGFKEIKSRSLPGALDFINLWTNSMYAVLIVLALTCIALFILASCCRKDRSPRRFGCSWHKMEMRFARGCRAHGARWCSLSKIAARSRW